MIAATPLRALSRGLAAGAAGTLAMDALWYWRYRRGGGEDGFADWELSRGLESWEDAGAPAQIGKRLFEGLLARELPGERAGLVNDVMHWSYGLFWGAQYGVIAASVRDIPGPAAGVAFGGVVWASDYVVLPLAKVYDPIWKYDAKTLTDDLTAHLLYGLVTATAFRLLWPGPADGRATGA